MKRRADRVHPNERDEPLSGGFSEFGYSYNVQKRLDDHSKHINSNYLMNLFESLSLVLFDGEYTFQRFVIYHIPALDLVELSEMYFTRIGQGYIKSGGGCSHAAAGLSTNSKHDFAEEHYKAF